MEQLKTGIFFAHQTLAAMASTPELALGEAEAEALSKAVANVARFYKPVAFSPKTAAWVGLTTTAGMIYIPRFMAVRRKKVAEKAATNPGTSL